MGRVSVNNKLVAPIIYNLQGFNEKTIR